MSLVRQRFVIIAGWSLAILPSFWLLTHPIPVGWLVHFAREPDTPGYVPSHFWPVVAWCLVPSLLALRSWRGREAVTFGWIALLPALWQAYCFNTGAHPARNPLLLWGLLPNTDSHYYLNNAVEIAEGIGIRSGFGARQMWPGFLALLHTGCNGDLKLMLSLLALLQAIVAVITWEIVRKLLGSAAAFAWLCCVMLFYRTHVAGLLVTEQLGLPLGMLAAVNLLYGWKRRSFVAWMIGLALLTFALNARPGCYFVLGLLLLATFWRFNPPVPVTNGGRSYLAKLSWSKGTHAIGLVAICLVCSTVSFMHLVNPPRMPSNFWFMLYGSTKGGNWSTAVRDFGGDAFSTDQISTRRSDQELRDLAETVKRAAIEEITSNPAKLLHVTWRAWKHAVVRQTFFFEPAAVWWGQLLLLLSLAGLILSVVNGHVGISDGTFYWVVWLGVFLSLPLAPPWDSGGRAYAATNPLVWLTPAAFVSWCANRLGGLRSNKQQSLAPCPGADGIELPPVLHFSATMGAVLVCCSVLLPSILLELNRGRNMTRYSDLLPLETQSGNIQKVSGALIRPNRGIMIGPRNNETFVPIVAREDFERGLPQGRHRPIGEMMRDLPDGSYIALLGRPRYLLCDPGVFRNGSVMPEIPLQDSDWMAYKYVFSLSKNLRLTERQVMILCPTPASHEIFWKSSAAKPGRK